MIEDKIYALESEIDIMTDAYKRILYTTYKIPNYILKGLDHSYWLSLLKEFVGRFSVEPYTKRSISIDTLYEELSDDYPYLFNLEVINQEDQLYTLIEFERKYRSVKHDLEDLLDEVL